MKYKNPSILSSYHDNNIGKTLYDLVLKEKPLKIIEFGTLNGYSTICMAMALHELKKGHIISYDLWEHYPYSHAQKEIVQETIKDYKLEKYITLEKGDFSNWVPEPFDLLHVDVSNTGETIKELAAKVKGMEGTVIFEGGTSERDRVSWMIKFNKMPILSSGVRFDIIDAQFPGLSRLI